MQAVGSQEVTSDREHALLIMKNKLKELAKICNSIAHPMLLNRLAILKYDLVSLIDKMKCSPLMIVSDHR